MAQIIDEDLLASLRCRPRCEWCQKPTPGCDPAHILTRGTGGGSRLDHRLNTVALCRFCHLRQHQQNRNPSRDDLLSIVAARERVPKSTILETLWEILRRPKEQL